MIAAAQLPGDPKKIDILTRTECFDLLGGQDVGRVAVSIGALPVIVPVNFAVQDESVLFRTILGSKLDTATVGAVVAFEADRYEPVGPSGWSVLIQGKASEIGDPRGQQLDERLPLSWWDERTDPGRLVRLEGTHVTGRRFRPLRWR